MGKLWLSFLTIFISLNIYCQTKITGTVKSSVDETPLYGAQIVLKDGAHTVQSDRIGYFQFVSIPDGTYTLEITKVGYESYEQQVIVNGQKLIELNDLYLTYAPQSVEVGVITLTSDELSSDESSQQSSVGLLQSSRDVFARAAAYELGAFWFRTRGYDNKYSDVYFNGVKMNKIDNGRVDYSNWGGLNDITRYPAEVTYGIEPSDYAFGNLGGVTYIDTRPSTLRTGTSLSYSLTNRSYRQRLMLTHNTGLNAKGWGFTVSGSRRWANEGRIEGTFYDAWGYFLGIEKRFNNKHTLLLSAFGAPTKRSTNSPNTQEIYDLLGTGYNAYWGYQDSRVVEDATKSELPGVLDGSWKYQDGAKRSERIKNTFEPVFSLTHYWDITDHSKLTTTVAYQTGSSASSRLDWNNADNPSPNYYRNMPSNADNPAILQEQWLNDINRRQIDWLQLYRLNQTLSGNAKYFLVADVNKDKTLTLNTHYRNQVSNNFSLYANLSYQRTKSNNFRRLEDLLGAKYVLDQDDFAPVGVSGDYDTNNPDRQAVEGDKVQYNYDIDHAVASAYAAATIKEGPLSVTIGGKLSNTEIQRTGLYDYYRYTNSKGKSEKYNFLDYGAKLNATYKINGRNYLVFNGAYYTNAPTANETFPQQRTNNLTIPGLESAKIMSGDLNYVLRAPRVKARATAFYTLVKDEVQTAFGYLERDLNLDSANVFTAEVLKGIDKEYLGSELAVEAQITTTFTVNAAASIGQYIYKNNPDLYYFSDKYAENGGFEYQGKSYLKNYKLASSPQKAVSVGFQYRSPNYWWFGMTGNYLAENYVSLAATRRNEGFFINKKIGRPYKEFVKDQDHGGEITKALLTQEQFKNAFMLNANAGKTFRIGKYYMGVSITVDNILNNKEYKTGGFEQLRLANYQSLSDPQKQKTFGNKYWYNLGTSYFFNVFLRF